MLSKSSSTGFKRHAVWLLIGAHSLLACNAHALTPLPYTGHKVETVEKLARGAWPVAAHSLPEALLQPNFSAPSADNCAREIRTKEIPGQAAQAPKNGGWASPAATLRSKSAEVGGVLAESAAADSKRKSSAAPASSPAERSEMAAAPAANMMPPTGMPWPQPPVPAPTQPSQPVSQVVTAGVVDDNANFGDYLAFRARTQVAHRARDIAERYLLQVKDAAGRAVADAEVWVQAPSGASMWARTDAGGQVWLSPNAFDASRAATYQVNVRKPGRWSMAQATAFLQRGQKSAVEVVLDAAPQPRVKLDLVFLIDATGSMQDEIDKLKATLHTIASEVARLPAKPDLCFGLVAYRDKHDAFLVRSHDFTNNLVAFQTVLNQLQAAGGGDYPEAMNEALNETVHNLSWRGNGTSRMVFLIADAPPHLHYGGPQYDDDMLAALGKGIKIFSVGASGLDKQGEYIQRQMAQYTGGKFVFLTYDKASNPASGPGRETVHDVTNYGVDTLDRLITRLVREELAKWGKTS